MSIAPMQFDLGEKDQDFEYSSEDEVKNCNVNADNFPNHRDIICPDLHSLKTERELWTDLKKSYSNLNLESSTIVSEFVTEFTDFIANENCFLPPVYRLSAGHLFFAWPPHGVFIHVDEDDTGIKLDICQSVDELEVTRQFTLHRQEIVPFFRRNYDALRCIFPCGKDIKYVLF